MVYAREDVENVLAARGWREVRQIGEGSFAKALLVEAADGTQAVCKVMDITQASKKEAEAAAKEGRLLASLRHPFVVRYRDSFCEAGVLCIIMDFCEGGELARQIRRARRNHQRIPEEQILRWFTQATLAVKFIHDKHILHRDLKPANFFLTKNGSLKMGDFGIAKTMACTLACAKTRIGTPYYLSPEVCQEKPYNWSSDMWSMGCILYEMCALQVPFDAHSISGLVQKICYGPLPVVPDCYSDFLRRLCRQLLDREPKKRPSADEEISRLVLGTALVLLGVISGGNEDMHRETFAQVQRRAAAATVIASLSLPWPAQAGVPLVSFTSGGWVEYTVGGAFQVSMPDNYKVLEETATRTVWQGDRTGQYNTMSAEVIEVDADTLEKALGMEGMGIKDIGEKLSDKRPLGGADFYGVEQLEGMEAYRFEFVGDSIHEYVMHALVRKASTNLLCTVTTRAAGLLWSNNDRFQTFAKIIASFKPKASRLSARSELLSVLQVLQLPEIQRVVRQMLEEVRSLQREEQAAKGTAASAAGTFRKDDLVEYYSVTHGEWLPAIVVDADALGRVMIDLRPGVWLSSDVQASKMRPRRQEGSSDSSGSEATRPERVSEEDPHGPAGGDVSVIPAPADHLKKLPNGRRAAAAVALRLRDSPRPPEDCNSFASIAGQL
ncbi:NEK1 [Symbiodinium pilosum]|uniref:non-specific serine/threonine protein kinase n=1 Tax=Symbiodinium pilosum TaxID=2952 RepID=A0A812MX78_SYMPI|nr:NEK1 [Symbiodinium pilosum]